MTPPRRRLAIAVATLAFAGFATTACGAVGQAVDCGTMSQEVTKISSEFTTAMGGAGTDIKAIEKASKDASDKLKALAGKYDGDLASGLNDMAAIFESIKADDTAGMTEAMGKIPDAQAKITKACS
ncbi:hypothetical protein HII36_33905 [Nonomuraea sp. NN258]|uniref:hypothetical protein n=1 Tax=Nonomuraea antri TaxID=2730852 RepID=UPI00156A4806|nr:hypothetical protein [Nonomuraea antri]NRQ36796.1 hypothetical protein [Nonomuraea antri]